MMKLIIAGTRAYTNKAYIYSVIDDFIKNEGLTYKDIEIVSGGARGVDTIAIDYAIDRGMKYIVEKPKWIVNNSFNKFVDKRAGFIRNKKMAAYGDVLIAFNYCNSKGTANMCTEMSNLKKKTYLIKIGRVDNSINLINKLFINYNDALNYLKENNFISKNNFLLVDELNADVIKSYSGNVFLMYSKYEDIDTIRKLLILKGFDFNEC